MNDVLRGGTINSLFDFAARLPFLLMHVFLISFCPFLVILKCSLWLSIIYLSIQNSMIHGTNTVRITDIIKLEVIC